MILSKSDLNLIFAKTFYTPSFFRQLLNFADYGVENFEKLGWTSQCPVSTKKCEVLYFDYQMMMKVLGAASSASKNTMRYIDYFGCKLHQKHLCVSIR